MPKKLTLVGVLAALTIGALAVFQGGTASAIDPAVQGFNSTGAFSINSGTCYYDGSGIAEHPILNAGHVDCGANTSSTNVANGTGGAAVESFTFIELSAGNRLTLPITFTPSGATQFQANTTVTSCGAVDPDSSDGRCTNLTETGRVTAQPDLFCGGAPYDVLAESKNGIGTTWPNDGNDGDGWIGFPFKRTEEAASGTGVPSNDSTAAPADLPFLQNAYTNDINPFPSSFPFVSLDTAILTKLFLGGAGAGITIPNTPLQLYTAESTYATDLNVSVALLGGNPGNPPTNDYLCLDSPQHSETNVTYLRPPTVDGLYPRWIIFTSAQDFANRELDRIVDLQCVGVGAVTAVAGGGDGDADDDCLTAAGGDTNDANPDQDGDGLFDGIEFYSGSSMTAADADGDGANDMVEMFQFSDPTDSDTDNDGSLDLQDNGADENTGNLRVDDTIADDNCPETANADQLNTDSTAAYHGGYTFHNNNNPGGANTSGTGPFTVTSVVVTTSGSNKVITINAASHDYLQNALVDVSGITGRSGGTAAENNAYAWYLNNGRTSLGSGTTAGAMVYTIPTAQVPNLTDGTATGTVVVRPSTGDDGNPDQDVSGDACDTDDDNDALVDVAEPQLRIRATWGGAGTTMCLGPNSGIADIAPAVPMNPLNGDSDRDLFLDGEECRQTSRPDISSAAIASCAALDADGCSQPQAATGCPAGTGNDPDCDALYPVGTLIGHSGVEAFYHTRGINQTSGPQENDLDGDGGLGDADRDADADWDYSNVVNDPPNATTESNLQDGLEVRFYGTEPAAKDSDSDGCDDAREIGDVNGDRAVNAGDQATVANRILGSVVGASLDSGANGDDVSGDRAVNPWGVNFDINKDRGLNPGDQALYAFLVSKGGSCAFNRQLGLTAEYANRGPFAPF